MVLAADKLQEQLESISDFMLSTVYSHNQLKCVYAVMFYSA